MEVADSHFIFVVMGIFFLNKAIIFLYPSIPSNSFKLIRFGFPDHIITQLAKNLKTRHYPYTERREAITVNVHKVFSTVFMSYFLSLEGASRNQPLICVSSVAPPPHPNSQRWPLHGLALAPLPTLTPWWAPQTSGGQHLHRLGSAALVSPWVSAAAYPWWAPQTRPVQTQLQTQLALAPDICSSDNLHHLSDPSLICSLASLALICEPFSLVPRLPGSSSWHSSSQTPQ